MPALIRSRSSRQGERMSHHHASTVHRVRWGRWLLVWKAHVCMSHAVGVDDHVSTACVQSSAVFGRPLSFDIEIYLRTCFYSSFCARINTAPDLHVVV
jgi:hypothetical protein